MKVKATQTNLVVPGKLTLEVHQVTSPNDAAQILQLPPGKIAIELHEPPESKTKWQRVSDRIGKALLFIKDVLPPLASVMIAFFVFYYGRQFNNRQATTQEKQADTSRSELELKILSDFTSGIAELTNEGPDKQKKQTLAAIKFVQYGEKALPVIKIALGVREDTVRKGATNVVTQMFQSAGIDRKTLLRELNESFKSQNAYLRRGVLECFVELEDHLSYAETMEVIELLKQHLEPQSDCSRLEEENVRLQAAVFLKGSPSSDSRDLLLKIAENQSCTRPRIQAVDNLPRVVKGLSIDEQRMICGRLRHMIPDSSQSFSQSVSVAITAICASDPGQSR